MSSYSDYANAVGNILTHQGDVAARAKEQSGQIWGSTLATLGDVVPKEVQQVLKDRAAKQKTAQIQGIIQQNGGDLEKSLPLIMGVDATIGGKLADEHAKVQKSIADVQKIQDDAKKAQLEYSDRLWSQVNDEGTYAHAAMVDKALGGQPLDHYDPEWVKQKKQSLMSLKDQLDANKPMVVGGDLVSPKGEVIYQGEKKPVEVGAGGKLVNPQTGETIAENPKAPSETGFTLAPGATRYDAQGNQIAAAPKDTSLTPYQQEELKRRDKELSLSQARLDLALKQANKPAIAKETGGLVDAVIASPELWGQLTPTAKAQIAPALQAKGFTAFQKPPSATVENRLASAKAVTQTGNDIIAQLKDPAVAQQLGPVLGRYNTLRDFLGNPPPELSELAGSIESFALANMGVHGMRSVQGADEIKSLLDRKHTPESLIKTIEGLNKFSAHFMENEGAATGPKVGDVKTFPNGKKGRWDGQGWELVTSGAK